MKNYKYLSLLVAVLLGMTAFTSCTNDDTEDAKAYYNISFVPSSLEDDALAAFQARANAILFAGETDNTRWLDFGLHSSRDYAQNSYNTVKTSKYEFIQDSLVNIIADQYNLAPGSFTVNMVLKDAEGNVLDNSAVWSPTVERKNLVIKLTIQDQDGDAPLMLDESIVSAINDSIVKIYGSEEFINGKTENVTPEYAKVYYANDLANDLQGALTNIASENNNYQDFRVCITIEDGAEVLVDKDVYPLTTYTVKYEITQGSLTGDQLESMKTNINTYVIGSAALSSYDITKATFEDAKKEFESLLRKANSALQNDIVNATAQKYEINDFYVDMQLVAADGSIVDGKIFEPSIGMDIYSVEIDVTGLSDGVLESQLLAALGSGKNVGLHTQAAAMDIFKTNVNAVNAADIIKQYAEQNHNINFDVDFILVNSKGVSVDVISYSGKDGWTYPTE